MKQEEFEAIENIVNELDNVEDLELLKKMISNAILERKTRKTNIRDVLDILSLDLRTFLQGELPHIKFRSFKPGAIISGTRRIKKYPKEKNVLVYDLIGIGEEALMLQPGIGERTVGVLENLLNKHGLSLNRQLTLEEKLIFESKHEDNRLKAM